MRHNIKNDPWALAFGRAQLRRLRELGQLDEAGEVEPVTRTYQVKGVRITAMVDGEEERLLIRRRRPPAPPHPPTGCPGTYKGLIKIAEWVSALERPEDYTPGTIPPGSFTYLHECVLAAEVGSTGDSIWYPSAWRVMQITVKYKEDIPIGWAYNSWQNLKIPNFSKNYAVVIRGGSEIEDDMAARRFAWHGNVDDIFDGNLYGIGMFEFRNYPSYENFSLAISALIPDEYSTPAPPPWDKPLAENSLCFYINPGLISL